MRDYDMLKEASYFKPYRVMDRGYGLVLTESRSRRSFLWIMYRLVLPLLALGLLSVLFIAPGYPVIWHKALLVMVSCVLITRAAKPFLIEIQLTQKEISMVQSTLSGAKKQVFLCADLEKITLEPYYLNHGGGYFYRLKLKNSSRQIPLLTIPFLYMRRKNRELINQKLTEITGLKVVVQGI